MGRRHCIFRTLRSNVRDLVSEERIVRMDGLIHSTRIHVILKCLWRREHARCRDQKQRQTSKRIRRLQSNWIRRHAEIRDIPSWSCESYIELIDLTQTNEQIPKSKCVEFKL